VPAPAGVFSVVGILLSTSLHAGVDITVIALWLGHESVTTTQIYLQADMALKQQALDRTTPPATAPGRYRPPDQLLAFLEAL
jgi:integrase/recombinase XerD